MGNLPAIGELPPTEVLFKLKDSCKHAIMKPVLKVLDSIGGTDILGSFGLTAEQLLHVLPSVKDFEVSGRFLQRVAQTTADFSLDVDVDAFGTVVNIKKGMSTIMEDPSKLFKLFQQDVLQPLTERIMEEVTTRKYELICGLRNIIPGMIKQDKEYDLAFMSMKFLAPMPD
jgi:hypothetical protein